MWEETLKDGLNYRHKRLWQLASNLATHISSVSRTHTPEDLEKELNKIHVLRAPKFEKFKDWRFQDCLEIERIDSESFFSDDRLITVITDGYTFKIYPKFIICPLNTPKKYLEIAKCAYMSKLEYLECKSLKD